MAGIDERLLDAQRLDLERQEEAANADKLRQEQAAARDKERQEEVRENIEGGKYRDVVDELKQKVFANRMKQMKEGVMAKADVVSSGVGVATGRFYLWAWGLVFSVVGFFLGVLLVDLYVMCRAVFGKSMFPLLVNALVAKGAKGAAGGSMKDVEGVSALGEGMGVFIINLIAIIILLVVLSLMYLVFDFLSSFWGKVFSFFGLF